MSVVQIKLRHFSPLVENCFVGLKCMKKMDIVQTVKCAECVFEQKRGEESEEEKGGSAGLQTGVCNWSHEWNRRHLCLTPPRRPPQ